MKKNKEILSEEIPNITVLNIAYQFHYLSEYGCKSKKQWDIVVATTVNASLALELYLKSFTSKLIGEGGIGAVINGREFYNYEYVQCNIRSHKMSEIYQAIDEITKKDLEKGYPGLGVAVSKFDHVFVGWRYIFENSSKGVEMAELYSLLDFFREYTLNKINA